MQNQHNAQQRPWWHLVVACILICILIVGCPIAAALATYVSSAQMIRVYRATTTLLVQSTTEDSQVTEKMAHTYAEMLTARPVLEATIGHYGLNMTWEELEEQVTTEVVPDTHLIRLSVEDTDSIRAAAIANTIASESIAQNQTSDSLIVLEQAQVPTTPIRPRMALNTALGGVAGMVLAIGFVVLFIVITAIKSSRNHQKKL